MTQTDTEKTPPPPGLRFALILLTIVYVLALAPAGLMAMVSPMMADGGVTPMVVVAMVATMTFPIALLMSPLAAWIAYSSGRKYRIAWGAILAPLIWLIPLGAYFSTLTKG